MKKDKVRSHCSAKVMPVPQFTVCTKCGGEIEVWSDEDEKICSTCGHRIFRTEAAVHQY